MRDESTGYFPLFVDLSRYRVLVVGAGRIALRRIRTLLAFTEHLEVAAETACPEIEALALEGRISLTQVLPNVTDYNMVLLCTDNKALNSSLYRRCREAGVLANNCSDREECDFFFPSVVKRGPLVLGLNAAGTDHRLVKDARIKIEKLMGGNDAHYNRDPGESSGSDPE